MNLIFLGVLGVWIFARPQQWEARRASLRLTPILKKSCGLAKPDYDFEVLVNLKIISKLY